LANMRKVLKATGYVVGSLVLIAVVLLGYILIEDRQYSEFLHSSTLPEENRKALLLTWNAEDSDAYWAAYEQEMMPVLTQLHGAGDISLVIPLEHPPLQHPDHPATWTHATLILLENLGQGALPTSEVLNQVRTGPLSAYFFAADLLRMQPNLDMIYPVKDGLSRESAMRHVVEYVFSDPVHRQQYYQDQYVWSGPAMQELHHRDKMGRFMGFEVETRLAGSPGLPAWDLVHLIGYTPWQTVKSLPFFYSIWNAHAERAFGPGNTFDTKLAEWDKIRLNVKSSAIQHHTTTLQDTKHSK
ncbi:MAG: hypothetical protein AAFQ98_25575, partial [Bacteroidota bacterium]